MRVASRRRRLLARLVDWAWMWTMSVSLVGTEYGFTPGPGEMVKLQLLWVVVFLGIGLASEVIGLKFWGQTPGKTLLGLRVMSSEASQEGTVRRLTGFQCLWRPLGRLLCVLMLGAGYAVALWDTQKRTLPDLLARTRVMSI